MSDSSTAGGDLHPSSLSSVVSGVAPSGVPSQSAAAAISAIAIEQTRTLLHTAMSAYHIGSAAAAGGVSLAGSPSSSSSLSVAPAGFPLTNAVRQATQVHLASHHNTVIRPQPAATRTNTARHTPLCYTRPEPAASPTTDLQVCIDEVQLDWNSPAALTDPPNSNDASASVPPSSIVSRSLDSGRPLSGICLDPTTSTHARAASQSPAAESTLPPPPPLPPFLTDLYTHSRIELSIYDALIRRQLTDEFPPGLLKDVEVVIGIPFYNELTNLPSVLVTMREVFQQRKIRTLFVILGESSRRDCLESLDDMYDIELGEPWEHDSYVAIKTMLKPSTKYISKPWTVRALQIIATECGINRTTTTTNDTTTSGGATTTKSTSDAPPPAPLSLSAALSSLTVAIPKSTSKTGAHLLIMDADIQFNHWELSARSLVSALLDPLMSWESLTAAAAAAQAGSTSSLLFQPTPPATPLELVKPRSQVHHATTLFPPRVEGRTQPLYPTPMPIRLVRNNNSDSNDTGDANVHDNKRAPSLTSFSPIFGVRCADEYPPTPSIPHLPSSSSSSSASLSSTFDSDVRNVKLRSGPGTFVVLNAPRSFFADDAIVHLVTYLHTYMSLGLEIHQSHGGEFAIHKDLNAILLKDETMVYERTYCMESQMAHRAAFIHPATHTKQFPSILTPTMNTPAINNHKTPAEPNASYTADGASNTTTAGTSSSAGPIVGLSSVASSELFPFLSRGSSVLEVQMKGKWHAKISLSKLLAFEGESDILNGVLQHTTKVGATNGTLAPAPQAAAGDTAAAAATDTTTAQHINVTHDRSNPFAASSIPASTYPAPAPPPPLPISDTSYGLPPPSRARIDLVSERLFNDTLFFSSRQIISPRASSPRSVSHHVGGRSYQPDPDPKAQSLKVLAPTSTRKQMVRALKLYYHVLLLEHVSSIDSSGTPIHSRSNLPPSSRFVRIFLPGLYEKICQRSTSEVVNYIITHRREETTGGTWAPDKIAQAEKDKYVIFGPREWAEYTVELLQIYRDATRPEQRRAVICGHRLVWLLGCIAFLNDHSHCLWGHMHSSLHDVYGPIFRRTYLRNFMKLDPQQIETILLFESRPEEMILATRDESNTTNNNQQTATTSKQTIEALREIENIFAINTNTQIQPEPLNSTCMPD